MNPIPLYTVTSHLVEAAMDGRIRKATGGRPYSVFWIPLVFLLQRRLPS